MNQQRGFTLLEMMLVLALVAITATPSAWRWVPLQEDAADKSQNDWDEELSIHLQSFKPDDSNQPQVVILADGQITPFSLLMANAGTGEPLLTLVCSGSWPLDQTLARDTRP